MMPNKQIRYLIKKLNPRDGRGRYKSEFWLFLIILFALSLRLYFFVGVGLNDDFVYTDLSNRMVEGKFELYLHPFIRPMMLLPIAFFFSMFGISHYSATLYILLTAVGILVVTFYMGKMLFNKSVGLIAALIASFVPIFVIFSSEVVPDIPIAFFWGLSVLLFLRGERDKERPDLIYFLSGCSVGLAYLTKSLGAIGLLFFLFYFLYKRQFKKSYLLVILGFVLIFSIEGTYYHMNTGDFLASFKANANLFTNPDFRSPGQFPDQLFYLNMFRSLDSSSRFGLLFVLFAISAAYGLYKRDRPLILLLIWFMSLYLFLEFGSMSYQKFVPIHKIDRFSIVLLIPMSIAASSLLLKINRKLASIILAALFVASIAHISNLYMEQRPEVLDKDVVYETMKNTDKKIFSDEGTVASLQFRFGYKKSNFGILQYASQNDIKDSYLVLYGSRGWIDIRGLKNKMLHNLSLSNAILIKTVEGPKWGVYSLFNPQILYVEDG